MSRDDRIRKHSVNISLDLQRKGNKVSGNGIGCADDIRRPQSWHWGLPCAAWELAVPNSIHRAIHALSTAGHWHTALCSYLVYWLRLDYRSSHIKHDICKRLRIKSFVHAFPPHPHYRPAHELSRSFTLMPLPRGLSLSKAFPSATLLLSLVNIIRAAVAVASARPSLIGLALLVRSRDTMA